MKYIGLLIILIFFVSTLIAFIKDVKYGRQKSDSIDNDELDKRKKYFVRGIVGIIIESILLCYFGVLLIYFDYH